MDTTKCWVNFCWLIWHWGMLQLVWQSNISNGNKTWVLNSQLTRGNTTQYKLLSDHFPRVDLLIFTIFHMEHFLKNCLVRRFSLNSPLIGKSFDQLNPYRDGVTWVSANHFEILVDRASIEQLLQQRASVCQASVTIPDTNYVVANSDRYSARTEKVRATVIDKDVSLVIKKKYDIEKLIYADIKSPQLTGKVNINELSAVILWVNTYVLDYIKGLYNL